MLYCTVKWMIKTNSPKQRFHSVPSQGKANRICGWLHWSGSSSGCGMHQHFACSIPKTVPLDLTCKTGALCKASSCCLVWQYWEEQHGSYLLGRRWLWNVSKWKFYVILLCSIFSKLAYNGEFWKTFEAHLFLNLINLDVCWSEHCNSGHLLS